jgi:hypothetical protein
MGARFCNMLLYIVCSRMILLYISDIFNEWRLIFEYVVVLWYEFMTDCWFVVYGFCILQKICGRIFLRYRRYMLLIDLLIL